MRGLEDVKYFISHCKLDPASSFVHFRGSFNTDYIVIPGSLPWPLSEMEFGRTTSELQNQYFSFSRGEKRHSRMKNFGIIRGRGLCESQVLHFQVLFLWLSWVPILLQIPMAARGFMCVPKCSVFDVLHTSWDKSRSKERLFFFFNKTERVKNDCPVLASGQGIPWVKKLKLYPIKEIPILMELFISQHCGFSLQFWWRLS